MCIYYEGQREAGGVEDRFVVERLRQKARLSDCAGGHVGVVSWCSNGVVVAVRIICNNSCTGTTTRIVITKIPKIHEIKDAFFWIIFLFQKIYEGLVD